MWIAPKYIIGLRVRARLAETKAEEKMQSRLAQAMLGIDPFEVLMKEFHGVFSEEYQRPEEGLNDQGRIQMLMFGYRTFEDPSFNHLINWMMNTQGNATLRAPHLNRDTALDVMLYGRAQISTGILLKKEVSRLASLYQEMIDKQKGEGSSISTSTVGE